MTDNNWTEREGGAEEVTVDCDMCGDSFRTDMHCPDAMCEGCKTEDIRASRADTVYRRREHGCCD